MPEGHRIAAAFFEEQDPVALAERMLRAGSPMRSGEDFLAAEGAIGEGLASADPDYDWIIHRGTRETPEPARTSAVLMRLSFARGDVVVHADLVPRHGHPQSQPGAILQPDESPEGQQARAWLQELMQSGGRLQLREGVRVRLSDVPAPFGDLLTDPLGGDVLVRAVAEPMAYYGRLTAGPPDERVALDIDLLPSPAPADWDAVLEGHVGGLIATIRYRWMVERRLGENRLTFHYHRSGAPHAVEARALAFMLAAHEQGAITLEDRTGERPSFEQPTPVASAPSWLALWARLHADLAELETAAGQPAPPVPDELLVEHVRAISLVAGMLRARRLPMTISDFTASFNPDATAASELDAIARDIYTRQTLVAIVFGRQLPVAYQEIRLPPMVIADRTRRADGGWDIRYVPLGADRAEIIAELVPLTEAQEGPPEP
jgi:hypothetical protein